MVARLDLGSFVCDIAKQYPSATRQELEIHVRNALQEAKRNGTKVSPKEIVKAQHIVRTVDLDSLKANYALNHNVTTSEAVKKLNTAKAEGSYGRVGNNVKTTSASKGNVQRVPRNTRVNKISRNAALVEGMMDPKQNGPSSLSEYIENLEKAGNNEELKRVKAEMPKSGNSEEYLSVKKLKKVKKMEQIKAQNEAQNEARKFRVSRSKINRDRHYCTQNGIMTSKARKTYNSVKDILSKPSKFVPFEPKLSNKSARESYMVFMEKAPEKLLDSKVTQNLGTKVKNILKGKWAIVGSAVAATAILVGSLVKNNKESLQDLPRYDLSA